MKEAEYIYGKEAGENEKVYTQESYSSLLEQLRVSEAKVTKAHAIFDQLRSIFGTWGNLEEPAAP
jgi:hypothetical protein